MKYMSVAIAAALLAGCSHSKAPPEVQVSSWENQTPPGQPLAREEAQRTKITATVKRVDRSNRLITLYGDGGSEITMKVDDTVRGFDRVGAGDVVTLDYLQSLAFEVRPPTVEELRNPDALIQYKESPDTAVAPGRGSLGILRSLVTVESIDHTHGTVTVKRSDGTRVTVQAKYPQNLDRIKTGDSVIVSYTEALLVGLEDR